MPGEDLQVLWEGYPAVSGTRGWLLGDLGNLEAFQVACSWGLSLLPMARCRECQQQTQSLLPWAAHLEGAPWMMWTPVGKYETVYKQRNISTAYCCTWYKWSHLPACMHVLKQNIKHSMQTPPTQPQHNKSVATYIKNNYTGAHFNWNHACMFCSPLVAHFNGPSLGPNQRLASVHPQIAWDWLMRMKVISLGWIMWAGEGWPHKKKWNTVQAIIVCREHLLTVEGHLFLVIWSCCLLCFS